MCLYGHSRFNTYFYLGDLEAEEEELDEATRQFNFWTHQVHIFFVRKFFPAAQRMLILMKLVQERYGV